MSQTAPDQHNQKVSGVARFGLTVEDLSSGSAPTLRSVSIALVLELHSFTVMKTAMLPVGCTCTFAACPVKISEWRPDAEKILQQTFHLERTFRWVC